MKTSKVIKILSQDPYALKATADLLAVINKDELEDLIDDNPESFVDYYEQFQEDQGRDEY